MKRTGPIDSTSRESSSKAGSWAFMYPGLRHHSGAARRGDHGIGVGQGEADRFLDEQVLPRLQHREPGLGLGVAVAQQDGVDVGSQQLAVIGDVSRDMELRRDRLCEIGGDVANHGDLEQVLQQGEVGQVMDLGDGAAADDSDPDVSHVSPHSRRSG